ncbi:19526_t:CDS:1, partial [Racocetra fulgida]
MKSAIGNDGTDIAYCDFTGNATGRFNWVHMSNSTFDGTRLSGQFNSGLTSPNATDYLFLLVTEADNSTALDMTQQIVKEIKIFVPACAPFQIDFTPALSLTGKAFDL